MRRPTARPADGRRPGDPDDAATAVRDGPDATRSSRAPDAAAYTPPPPTVSPEERSRVRPSAGRGRRTPRRPATAWRRARRRRPRSRGVMASAFGAHARTPQDGFAPPPGTRIEPSGAEPESPWWKRDARARPVARPGRARSGSAAARSSPTGAARPARSAAGRRARRPGAATTTRPTTRSSRSRPDGARFGLNAILLSVVIALVAGALGGFGGYWLGARTRDALHRTDVSLAQAGTAANRPPGSVAGIAKRVGPAVVSLAVTSADKSQYGVGSGVVIDKHGYVLTNNHVAVGGQGRRHDRRDVLRRGDRQGRRSSASTRSATSPCSRCPTTS